MGEPQESSDERRVALMLATIASYQRDKMRAERASSSSASAGDAAPWKSFGRRSQMRGMLR
jgi:hypothetical protein